MPSGEVALVVLIALFGLLGGVVGAGLVLWLASTWALESLKRRK